MEKIVTMLARFVAAYQTCNERGNYASANDHADTAIALARYYLPNGSGFDAGTKLDMDASTPDKLVFTAEFHHMNHDGYYTRWTSHKVIVRASLARGFDLKVTGRDYNGIKEYIGDAFHGALNQEIEPREAWGINSKKVSA